MPSELLIDPAAYENRPILYDRKEIDKFVPQRYEFAMLDGILEVDKERRFAVGFYEAREDSYWARGHIPGRPLMPGVLQIESAAQLCTFLYKRELNPGEENFMGFGGMNDARFRGTVVPPCRFITVVRCDQLRPRASYWTLQGFANKKLVFEGTIFAVAF